MGISALTGISINAENNDSEGNDSEGRDSGEILKNDNDDENNNGSSGDDMERGNENGENGTSENYETKEKEKQRVFELINCSSGHDNLLNKGDEEITIFRDKGITLDIEFRADKSTDILYYRLYDEISGISTEESIPAELWEPVQSDEDKKEDEKEKEIQENKDNIKELTNEYEKERYAKEAVETGKIPNSGNGSSDNSEGDFTEDSREIYKYKASIKIKDGYSGNIIFFTVWDDIYKSKEFITGSFIVESSEAAENNYIEIDVKSNKLSKNNIPLFNGDIICGITAGARISGIEECGITVRDILTGKISYEENLKRETTELNNFPENFEGEAKAGLGSGDYLAEVYIRDRAGYINRENVLLSVDRDEPVIEYKYLEKGISTNKNIFPQITVHDGNISPENIHISLKGEKHGDTDISENISINEKQEEYNIFKVMPQLSEMIRKSSINCIINMSELRDDNYELSVEAVDNAGNGRKIILPFTVNKHGSVFIPDENIINLSDTFTNKPPDINITELNIDSMGDEYRQVLLYHNGIVKELKRGVEYNVTEESQNILKKYSYRIFNNNFKGNGTYSIMINTIDKAGNNNSSDSNDICKIFRFCVDRNKPEITKLSDNKHESNNDVEYLFVINDNIAVKNFEYRVDDGEPVYVNNISEIKDFGEITGSGSGTDDNILNIAFKPDGCEHSVYIKSYDMAGNMKDVIYRGLSVRKPTVGETYKREYLTPALDNIKDISENKRLVNITVVISILVLSSLLTVTICILALKRKKHVRFKNKK